MPPYTRKVELFDMKKFQNNVSRELHRAYPDRRRLEVQCLSVMAFVKNEPELLDSPIWVLIINVVALDMLKSKLPPDPYSVAGSGGSSDSSGNQTGANIPNMVAVTRERLLQQQQRLLQRRNDKPPKLPPRDTTYSHNIPKPDYDDTEEEKSVKSFSLFRSKEKNKDKNKIDDPYYCGLRARVPKFVNSKKNKTDGGPLSPKIPSFQPPHPNGGSMSLHPLHNQLPPKWHAGSFDSGMDSEVLDHIYGRLPIPTRGYIPTPMPRTMYIGEWE
uniref:MH2 domain-containing protein n=1 Tax=Timema genevievae TaxID=629358 RepID=A0A7R9PKA1_TIMGE|nr:unnamed protein product [Timema genevievae]